MMRGSKKARRSCLSPSRSRAFLPSPPRRRSPLLGCMCPRDPPLDPINPGLDGPTPAGERRGLEGKEKRPHHRRRPTMTWRRPRPRVRPLSLSPPPAAPPIRPVAVGIRPPFPLHRPMRPSRSGRDSRVLTSGSRRDRWLGWAVTRRGGRECFSFGCLEEGAKEERGPLSLSLLLFSPLPLDAPCLLILEHSFTQPTPPPTFYFFPTPFFPVLSPAPKSVRVCVLCVCVPLEEDLSHARTLPSSPPSSPTATKT